LRREPFKLAKRPLEIVSIVFLSSKNAGASPLLNPLSRAALRQKLAIMQAYGASQPQWQTFTKNVSRLPTFELLRGRHPMDAADVLRTLLAGR
jgi:hypothetical protein